MHNYSHWLSIPASISFRMLPDKKFSLELLMGSTLNWNLMQHWLISDSFNSIYYYSNELSPPIQISVDGGIRIIVHQSWQTELRYSSGISHASFLNQANNHWNLFGLTWSKFIGSAKKKSNQ